LATILFADVAWALQRARSHLGGTDGRRKAAALERSDNVAHRDHAFAELKRGYLPGKKSSCKKVRCAPIQSPHAETLVFCPPSAKLALVRDQISGLSVNKDLL